MRRDTEAVKPGHLARGNPCQHESKSVMECIYARRSVRSFRSDPIPEEVVRQILEAGRFAACPGGAESWRFGVIRDQQRKEQLAKAAGEQVWVASAPVVLALCADIRSALPGSGFARVVDDARFGTEFVSYTAQCPDSRAMAKFWANSVPLLPGAQMNLAAISFGLGACWVGYLDTDEASRILGLPDHIVCLYLMPIGYPAERLEPASRSSLRSMAFCEEWGKDAGAITDPAGLPHSNR